MYRGIKCLIPANLKDFEDLVGQTIINCEILDGKNTDSLGEEIIFTLENTEKYRLFHYQDCCEDVHIHEIVGELSSICGEEILSASVESNSGECEDEDEDCYGTYTWTFYRLNTIGSSVTISFHGSSNGYYSEDVSFELMETEQ